MQTRVVIANFSQNHNMAFYDSIMSQVNDIDIGLVILNAGVSHSIEFVESESKNL